MNPSRRHWGVAKEDFILVLISISVQLDLVKNILKFKAMELIRASAVLTLNHGLQKEKQKNDRNRNTTLSCLVLTGPPILAQFCIAAKMFCISITAIMSVAAPAHRQINNMINPLFWKLNSVRSQSRKGRVKKTVGGWLQGCGLNHTRTI